MTSHVGEAKKKEYFLHISPISQRVLHLKSNNKNLQNENVFPIVFETFMFNFLVRSS